MKAKTKYRLPIYLTGFLIGTLVAVTTYQAKRVFAPNFHQMSYEGNAFLVKNGEYLVLSYDVEKPGLHLAYGYPSEVFVAKVEKEGVYTPIARVPYRDLVEKTVRIGPLKEAGQYIFRGVFYICETPGDKDCVKLIWNNLGAVKIGAKEDSGNISIKLTDWLAKLKAELGSKFNQ